MFKRFTAVCLIFFMVFVAFLSAYYLGKNKARIALAQAAYWYQKTHHKT